MKRLLTVCLGACFAASLASADPSADAVTAMMRLSDAPSYSWVATVSDDARTYEILGRTSRDGFTQVKMPVINSVRRQLGRSTADTQIELIFRGNVQCVIETEEGWKTLDELRSHTPPADTRRPGTAAFIHPRGSIRRPTLPRPPTADRGTNGRYSNLQLGISHPHEELGVIVGSHETFEVAGEIVTGTLSDLGAQLLLVRDGQESIEPLRAAGSFKIWLHQGMVTRYRVELEGVLNIQVSSGRRKIQVHQVTETILSNIGTTTFEVPMQARLKLGS